MTLYYSLYASLSGCLDLFLILYMLYTGGPHFEKFSGVHVFGLQTTNRAFQIQKGPPPHQLLTVFDHNRPVGTGRNWSELVGNGRKQSERSETVGSGRSRVWGGTYGEIFFSLYVFVL